MTVTKNETTTHDWAEPRLTIPDCTTARLHDCTTARLQLLTTTTETVHDTTHDHAWFQSLIIFLVIVRAYGNAARI